MTMRHLPKDHWQQELQKMQISTEEMNEKIEAYKPIDLQLKIEEKHG